MSQWHKLEAFKITCEGREFKYKVAPCSDAPAWHDGPAAYSFLIHVEPESEVTPQVLAAIKAEMQQKAMAQ
jgi:hypothetical protein